MDELTTDAGANTGARRRTRSPAYPAIDLPEAVDLTRSLYQQIHHHAVAVDAVADVLGIKGDGSSFKLKISALKKYGLLEDKGEERVELTVAARDIAILEETDPVWLETLRSLVLNPSLYRELWEKFGPVLPGDATLRSYLLRERQFNPNSVERAVRDFRTSIEFSGLRSASNSAPEPAEPQSVLPLREQSPPALPVAESPLAASTAPSPPLPAGGDALQIPLGDGRYAVIPSPMDEEMYDVLLETLQIWKRRLVRKVSPNSTLAEVTPAPEGL